MNINILIKTVCGSVLMLLASCTSDNLIDDQGNTLPEGKYPLEIGSVSLAAEVDEQPWRAGAPQTRVSENPDGNSSHWDGGETIIAQIGNDNTNRGIYTVNVEEGNVTLTPVEPAYWKSTTPQKVKGWCPSVGETIDLSKQNADNSLAYALYAETTGAVDYNAKDIILQFEHKLAKVRVVLQGSDKDKVNSVMIKACTSCTLGADGSVTAGDTENFIPMVETTYDNGTGCWEANVVPGHEITAFQVNGVEGTLDNGITPLVAKVNTITLTVGDKSPDDLPEEITEGEYIVSGTGTKTITINGSPTITLRNVVLCDPNSSAINIIGGNPTLIFEGNNTLETKAIYCSGISLSNDASVTIEGKGNDAALEIKYSGGERNGGIGTATDKNCGDITIRNIKLTITSHRVSGIGSGPNSTCGNINIENSELNITSNENSACIGASAADHSQTATCGDITIKNCYVIASSPYWPAYRLASAVIGASTGNAHCGDINIYLKPRQTLPDFLSNLSGTEGTNKIGGGSEDHMVGDITIYDDSGSIIATGPHR